MFSIRLADRNFIIRNKYNYVFEQCRQYLTAEEEGVLISATEEEIQREQTGNYSSDYLESVAICRKIADYLIADSTILFHGSVVAVDNEAYLFTAASGYGKSTHARLWQELFGQRAVMINDDKPFLRITDHGILAYGSPWDGKHHLSTNTSAPLKAVCILERSQINYLEPISKDMAMAMLIRQTHRPADIILLEKTLMLIDKLSKNVETYRMWCNTEPEAARIAYNGMSERKALE